MNSVPTSLYVHIPFCQRKCYYCDFNTYVAGAEAKGAYTKALLRELDLVRQEFFKKGEQPRLDTLFFGGGTPTALALSDWERIADFLHRNFQIDGQTEWTVEANPGHTTEDLLPTLLSYGVNRLSLGVQTLNDTLLKTIGREHSGQDVARSLEMARKVGFRRISIDLMLGLPGQTMSDLQSALDRVLEYDLEHVSVYGLKVEPGTAFAKWQEAGRLQLPDEDTEVQMYELARQFLREHGVIQYEISNFAKLGEEARHNLVYWRNQPYLAVGAGAHGYVGGVRYENVKAVSVYQKHLGEGQRPVAATQVVSEREAREDSVILGLRLREGVSKKRFLARHQVALEQAFGKQISALVRKGWLIETETAIWIPEQYLPVANEIMVDFLADS